MPKPTLNFVWVGPPRFKKGGQDVVGPETFDKNFKLFSLQKTPPNPMVFWCQREYADQYKAYFAEKGVAIEVNSIEEWLETCPTEREHAATILKHYQDSILNSKRNEVIDRVYMKDMFFNFILATQGNYVLDTNIHANLKKSVNFPEYSTFKFPWVSDNESDEKIPEVWLQYAPPGDLGRAKACLERYLRLYEKNVVKHIQPIPYSKNYRDLVGRVATGAVTLSLAIKPKIEDCYTPTCDVWSCGKMKVRDIDVPELGISKEYNNSYREHMEHMYGGPHTHVSLSQIDRLRFDLDHGIPADFEANPSCIYWPELSYSAEHETLLHHAMLCIMDTRDPMERTKMMRCARLLLENGADANRIHTMSYKKNPNVTLEASPLTYALQSGEPEVVEMLFSYAGDTVRVDRILNNQSALLLAVKYNPAAIPSLIRNKGADPNQTWDGQKDTPLALSVRLKNKLLTELLLMLGADPNTPVCHNDYKRGKQVISETPLHIALKKQDSEAVALLLRYKANPLAVAQYEDDDKVIELRADQIETSAECQALLADAMKEHQQATPAVRSQSVSRHSLFQEAIADTKPAGLSEVEDKPKGTDTTL